jgi:hypothetical protein
MALTLSKINIDQTQTINAWHVTQSIDALTGIAAYDISISGSLALTGSLKLTGSVTTPPGTLGYSLPANVYGADSTKMLGTPTTWLSVNIDGATYKIPLYN